MAIVASDIQTRLSGGAANSNPNLSIGGVMSSTAWAGGVLHDLFDVITGDENAASTVDYRCVYVRNGHATLTLLGATVWLTSQTAGGATVDMGLDPAAIGNGTTTGVAATPANETTAPASVTYSSPASKAGGLVIGDIPAGSAKAIWFRRTAANSAAIDNDGVTLNIAGDTTA